MGLFFCLFIFVAFYEIWPGVSGKLHKEKNAVFSKISLDTAGSIYYNCQGVAESGDLNAMKPEVAP